MAKRMASIGGLIILMFTITACGYMKGSFYTLDKAYENGWLTIEDVKNIAYYYRAAVVDGGLEDESYIPTPITPEILDPDIENAIKNTYRQEIMKMPNASLNKIHITRYYGSYHDFIVIAVTDDYFDYDYLFEEEYVIGTVVIKKYCESLLMVWHKA